MFGDPNQYEPVETNSKVHYDYLLSKTIKQMCSKTVTLQIHILKVVADMIKKTYNMLHTFLKIGRISTYFTPMEDYYKNICYLNSTRIRVNKECCDKFVENKEYTSVSFKYNDKKKFIIFVLECLLWLLRILRRWKYLILWSLT